MQCLLTKRSTGSCSHNTPSCDITPSRFPRSWRPSSGEPPVEGLQWPHTASLGRGAARGCRGTGGTGGVGGAGAQGAPGVGLGKSKNRGNRKRAETRGEWRGRSGTAHAPAPPELHHTPACLRVRALNPRRNHGNRAAAPNKRQLCVHAAPTDRARHRQMLQSARVLSCCH